jgi:hypothetical protein
MGAGAVRGQHQSAQQRKRKAHVPNGIYPVPKFRFQDDRATAARRPSLRLRLRVLVHQDSLDDQLARGVDPAGSEALQLRAQQLLARRAPVAKRLEEVLTRARKRSAPFTAEVPVRRADVRDCADDLLALARRLNDGHEIDVQGVAMTARLLTDGCGPLYRESDYSLRYAVRTARLALDPVGAGTEDLATAA